MAKQKRRPANDRAGKKYQTENMWIKNKARKIEKHLAKHPNDLQSLAVMKSIDAGKGPTYNRNNVPKKHTIRPEDKWFAEQKAKVDKAFRHYAEFGGNIDKTPSKPDWVKILEPLIRKPKIKVKRRGHRRVKN